MSWIRLEEDNRCVLLNTDNIIGIDMVKNEPDTVVVKITTTNPNVCNVEFKMSEQTATNFKKSFNTSFIS